MCHSGRVGLNRPHAFSHCALLPQQANVICIVYAVNNKKSIEKVSKSFPCFIYLFTAIIDGMIIIQIIYVFMCAGDQSLDSTHN